MVILNAIEEHCMKKVNIELTIEQAEVVRNALDLYNRISLCQIEEVAVVMERQFGYEIEPDSMLNWYGFKLALKKLKHCFGFSENASYGVGNPSVGISGSRSYEILKVLEFALAMDKDPNPSFRTVYYDGLTLRYTQDEEPKVEIIEK
jgi:hypothetical protein